jgi:lipoprotein-anchoring transpeptidase ErfK/SrfK
MQSAAVKRFASQARAHRRWIVAAAVITAGFAAGVTTRRALAESAPSDDPQLNLVADLSQRTLHVRMGDDDVETYPIAVGKDAMPTPTGNYKIRKIVWNPAWVPPDSKWAKGKKPEAPGSKKNPMKLVKIFFREPDYYIHGTSDVESLGDAASHGCLRMNPDDAYRVARDIMEHGGSPRDENWFWRVLHFRSESKTVYLDNPIPLTVRN